MIMITILLQMKTGMAVIRAPTASKDQQNEAVATGEGEERDQQKEGKENQEEEEDELAEKEEVDE